MNADDVLKSVDAIMSPLLAVVCSVVCSVGYAMLCGVVWWIEYHVLFFGHLPGRYLKSYQKGYRLVTVCTQGDIGMLPQWEIRPPASYGNTTHSYIVGKLKLSQQCRAPG